MRVFNKPKDLSLREEVAIIYLRDERQFARIEGVAFCFGAKFMVYTMIEPNRRRVYSPFIIF